MKPPFDIAGDFDTPVSAFAKLAPFEPRFLLESVEGGERLGRYSFISMSRPLCSARSGARCRAPKPSCSMACAPR
jgi:anthranilate/para-aminobenzoate synthase component I